MARICPALQQLLNTKEVTTNENLASTPRRKPIKWSVLVNIPGCDPRAVTITATIERMNRRIGAGLPLSTMAKRDGKHKSGMPVAATAPKMATLKVAAPKAPKLVKATKVKSVKTKTTKRSVKALSTASAKDVVNAANKATTATSARRPRCGA